ncbi:MAG: hypothetical protein ACXQS5_01830 [Candidatus Methanospirareceae archaeon]
MTDVKSTTTNLGLIKYSRGHPVRDVDIATNMDVVDAAYQGGVKVAKGALAAGLVNTMTFAWQNPELTEVLVQRVIIDVTTAGGTATAIMDVGVSDTATGTAEDIISDLDLNAAAVTDHLLVAGTGVGGVHKLGENGGTNDYITGKTLTEAASDLVGKYYIEYVVV